MNSKLLAGLMLSGLLGLGGCGQDATPTAAGTTTQGCHRVVSVSGDEHATRGLLVTVSTSRGLVQVDDQAGESVTGLVMPGRETAFTILLRCDLETRVSTMSGSIRDVEDLPPVDGDEQRYNVGFAGDQSAYTTVGFGGDQRTVTLASSTAAGTYVNVWTHNADVLLVPPGGNASTQADYERLSAALGSNPTLDGPSERLAAAQAAWDAGQALSSAEPVWAAREMLSAVRGLGVPLEVVTQLEAAADGMATLTEPTNLVGLRLSDVAPHRWRFAGSGKADMLAHGLRADLFEEAHPALGADVTYRVVSASEPAAMTFSASTGSGEVDIPLPTGWVDLRYVAPVAVGL